MTIDQLLKMDAGNRIGGGFVLTVKTTKKHVQLPDKSYIFTVVLTDNTGDMLADFAAKKYLPFIKNEQVAVIVAQIQKAEKETKLFVEQWEKVKGKSEPDYFAGNDSDIEELEAVTRGKVRHGLTCSYIRAGKEPDKAEINKWVDFIMTGR